MRLMMIAAAACAVAGSADAKGRRAHAELTSVATRSAPETKSAAVGAVDGGWSVDAATTVGQCQGLIPGAIDVAGGKITGAAGLQGDAWGYIDGEGQIVARFTTTDGRVARFHGNLRGGRGSGAWSSSTDMCGGTWRATRGNLSAAQ